MTKESLNKRYFSKLSTNLLGLPISLIIQAIVPRGLGPEQYGNFTFLTNLFQKILNFVDAGTSIAFYTKLSQNLEDFRLIKFYLIGAVLFNISLAVFVFLVYVMDLQEFVFSNQLAIYVWMALLYSALIWLMNIANKIIDAYGMTTQGELLKLFQKIVGLGLILILFFLNQISLFTFFIYHYIVIVILIISWGIILSREYVNVLNLPYLSSGYIKAKANEFWKYSAPLISYAFVVMLVGIFDYWYLERVSGSIELGFFGLSHKISAICFLFTGAMTPLITREFSIASKTDNRKKLARLFTNYIPLLFFVASFFSTFLFVNVEVVTYLFGGEEFQGAILSIGLMSLYPIHQTYGQLSGSVFYATGQTKLYRNIGVVLSLIGLLISYILISPSPFGFNLGAFGLALKMILIQFLGVNVQLYFNSRYLSLSFIKFLGHQLAVIGILLLFGYLSHFLTSLAFADLMLIHFLVSGVLYTILVTGLILAWPGLIFRDRSYIFGILRSIKQRIFR